ncbi:MAG: DUF4783 domain-containing protein [Bacteroidota bacterium]
MKSPILLLIIVLLLPDCEAFSQTKPKTKTSRSLLAPGEVLKKDSQQTEISGFFYSVEKAVGEGIVEPFTSSFATSVFVNVTNGQSGYLSASQAASVLANYFGARKPIGFKFTRMNDSGPAPYATGRFSFVQNGTQGASQVYVSLTYQTSHWVISQFNIY